MSNIEDNKLAVFQGKHIRKLFHEGEWWFSIIDVIEVLTDSSIPKRYWSDLKRKLAKEGFSEAYEKIVQLKMLTSDSKMRLTDCANTETMFRIIQSIPSVKVEPLKRWLARVGKERIDEIKNPELSMERMKELYEKKGYPKEWIDGKGETNSQLFREMFSFYRQEKLENEFFSIQKYGAKKVREMKLSERDVELLIFEGR